MRLYVAVCGLGLGHASRCLALAEEARRRGVDVAFSTYVGEASALLKSRGFEVYEAPSMSYLLNGEGDVDFKLTLARGPLEVRKLAVHAALEVKYMERAKPDVVVSDSRLSAVAAARLLGIPSALIINQLKLIIPRRRPLRRASRAVKAMVERLGCELLGKAWGWTSRILVPDFPPPLTISKENLHVPERLRGKVRLVGPMLDEEARRRVDKEEAKQALGVKGRLVLASIGGLREEKAQLLRAVVACFKEAEGLQVVASASLPQRPGLLLSRRGLKVYGWLPQHRAYLRAADILITHGGHTSIAEALCTATPMVIAPLKGHTERLGNARSMEELGVAKVVDLETQGPKGLGETVEEVLNDDSYRERAEELAEEALKHSAIEEVLNEVLRLRHA